MNMCGSSVRKFIIAPTNSKHASRTISRCSWRECHSDTQQKVKRFKDIPGPKPIPLLGNLWRYSSLFGEYSFKRLHLTYFKMYQQYGPLVKEKVFLDNIIVHVYDPEDMYKVYMNEGRKHYRKSHQALSKYRKDRPHIYNSAGLFPSNAEEWYRFRQLFQRILISPQTADSYMIKLEEITEDMLRRIAHLLDDKGETDIQPILFNWALECIGVITLNCRLGCLSDVGNKEADDLVKCTRVTHQAVFDTEVNTIWKYFPTPSYYKLVSAQDFCARTVKKYMDKAVLDIEEKGTDSLLKSMLNIESIEKKDVFTMILDMFLAGIDTTAYTTAFGLYNLAINQEVQEKLYEELFSQLPCLDSKLSEKKSKLSYLQQVIKESLRINPVSVGTGRVLPTDMVLSGYHVPKDTMVILQHQVACKLSRHFTEPERFLPDRWNKNHPYFKEINRNVSSPFGFGPRLCIGKQFAEREMIMALGKVIRKFKISYHHDPIDCQNRLINVPDRPVKLRFELRKN